MEDLSCCRGHRGSFYSSEWGMQKCDSDPVFVRERDETEWWAWGNASHVSTPQHGMAQARAYGGLGNSAVMFSPVCIAGKGGVSDRRVAVKFLGGLIARESVSTLQRRDNDASKDTR
jgi:hypothetical protein